LGTVAGAVDFGGATSVELPNGAAPTTDATGEIAIDTTITDHKSLIQYDGGEDEMLVIAIPRANLDTTDGDVIKYDAATDAFVMAPDNNSGSATAFNDIGDTTGAGAVGLGHTNVWTYSLDGGIAVQVLSSDADNSSDTTLLRLSFNDSADANSIFLEMVDDQDGTPRSVFKFAADGFTSSVAGSFGTGNGQVDIGAAGVRLSSDGDGAITLLGLGDGSDEDLTINLDDTSNTAVLSSSTGLTLLDLGAIGIDLDSSSLKIPTGNDPDIATEGLISWDANGDYMRIYDGASQVAVARKTVSIHVTVVTPNDLTDAVRDAFWFWSNDTGMSFVVTDWDGWSDTDDTSLDIEVVDADGTGNAATVDAVELATGSGPYTGTGGGTITAATVAAGRMLRLDFNDTDTPGIVKMVIRGYFNADVN
jgi:hypothetical protein